MKKIQVILVAFGRGAIREVSIPDTFDETIDILNEVFEYGQNQHQQLPSISVGDIILLGTTKHIVKGFGFEKITDEFYNKIMEFVEKSKETGDMFAKTYRELMWNELREKSFEYC